MAIGPFSEGAVGSAGGGGDGGVRFSRKQLFPQEGITQKKKGEIHYAREKDLSLCLYLSTA